MFPRSTKKLDDAGISVNDPASFCFFIDSIFSSKMINLIVLFVTDQDDEYCQLSRVLTGVTKVQEIRQRDYLIFVSASLDVWEDNIINMCSNDSTSFARKIGNDLLIILKESSFFKRVFNDYTRVSQGDGTFSLCKK